MRAIKDCTAGSVGGILQVLVGQPFDTVKVVSFEERGSGGGGDPPSTLPFFPLSNPLTHSLITCFIRNYKPPSLWGWQAPSDHPEAPCSSPFVGSPKMAGPPSTVEPPPLSSASVCASPSSSWSWRA